MRHTLNKNLLFVTALSLFLSWIHTAIADDATAPVQVQYAADATELVALQDGAKIFTNREYTLQNVSGELAGLQFTRRPVGKPKDVEIDTNAGATVYVLVDSDQGPNASPEVNQGLIATGWTKITGLKYNVPKDKLGYRDLSAYKQTFAAAQRITLTHMGKSGVIVAAAAITMMPPPDNSPFQVLSATWGDGDKKLDVTDKVKSLAKKDSLDMIVDNSFLGDPATGAKKTLTLAFKWNGKDSVKTFSEFEHISIGAVENVPGLKGPVQIIKAMWGVPGKERDVTKIVREKIIDGGLTLTPRSEEFGDPQFGTLKTMFLIFQMEGRQFYKRYAEGETIALAPAPLTKRTPNDKRRGQDSNDPTLKIVDAGDPSYPDSIHVPCARPISPSTVPAAPSDPSVIARPEFQNAPKPLVRSLSSITAMMVTVAENGDESGLTSDIIATVPQESRRGDRAGVGLVRVEGMRNNNDDLMKASLEEAVRAVTIRYPIWEPGHIDLSFGEKFVTHGGPSAGTAFGVLMLSTLDGFEIDPKCAVTGDITVDWKVRKVGGVIAKLRGAALDHCLYAAVPEGDATAVADMALLDGHSALWNMQIFSINTLQDAVALTRTDRSTELSQAISLFAALQPQLAKNEPATLHAPATQDTLRRILELAPNHLSAKYLLALADGSAVKTLSANATLYQLSIIFYPFEHLDGNRPMDRPTLLQWVIKARKGLAALRPIANPDIRPLLAAMSSFIESLNDYNGERGRLEDVRSRAAALDARFDDLASDHHLVEKLVHEGY